MTDGQFRFYRVQSNRSFTEYDKDCGFTAPGRDHPGLINKYRFERHLAWNDRSDPPTPFISVFDSWDDAKRRAEFLVGRGHDGVFIADILVRGAEPAPMLIMDIAIIILPTFVKDSPDTIFISTEAVRHKLGVDHDIGQWSEWFFLGRISHELIERTIEFN